MRRAQLGVCVRQLDVAGEERFQRSDVITRFTSDFSEGGERLAVSLADVLSRDSATRVTATPPWSQTADTYMARRRGARGDA